MKKRTLRSLMALFLVGIAGGCACSIAPHTHALTSAPLVARQKTADLIADLATPQRSSAAIQRLAEIGAPAGLQLVKALESPAPQQRENAAALLRQILSADPGAAPNHLPMAVWLGRILKVDEIFMTDEAGLALPSGSSPLPQFALLPGHGGPFLADLLAILLPDQKTGQILNGNRCAYRVIPASPFDGLGDGGRGGEVIYQLDDYTSATFRVRGAFALEIVQRPDFNLFSPRAVIVEPPVAFTGVWKNFYVNGEKYTEEHYVAGKLEGQRRVWRSDGTLQSDDHWHDGWRLRDGR